MKKTIGVIGVGVVGNALKTYFEQEGFEVYTYDKFVCEYGCTNKDFNVVCKADYIFLCLPTPHNKKGGYDLSAFDEILPKIPDGKTVIIKSTVLPGTVDKFQKQYPRLRLLFNPEFLTAKYAKEEFRKPEAQIIGYTEESRSIARDVLILLPEAQFERVISAKEAEMVKMARNAFFVTKIVFANMLYDLCQQMELDYETIKDCFSADRRIRRSHLDILHQGGRGGGGMCFPKDIGAFNDLISTFNSKMCDDVWQFFGLVEAINKRLLELSGKK